VLQRVAQLAQGIAGVDAMQGGLQEWVGP